MAGTSPLTGRVAYEKMVHRVSDGECFPNSSQTTTTFVRPKRFPGHGVASPCKQVNARTERAMAASGRITFDRLARFDYATRKKNGSQQAMKLPMISPRMSVARFSFLRAIRRFSFSGSRGFGFGSAGSSSLHVLSVCLAAISCEMPAAGGPPPEPAPEPAPEPPVPAPSAPEPASMGWVVQWLPRPAGWPAWRAFALPLPKMGWQRRNLSGFTTAHRLITPESELDGSNSLTMSVSMPTESARPRAAVPDVDTASSDEMPLLLFRCCCCCCCIESGAGGACTFSVSLGSACGGWWWCWPGP
uniref:Uncharacterized protein n=1 Tax=Anopheles atroparvus TaxID=41427 RepID=A0A182IUX8_ANOAO